jgi:predicted lactoylglutathione lyase
MDGDGILVHATISVDAHPGEDHDFAFVDQPEIEQVATILHRGAMDDVMPTIQALEAGGRDNGGPGFRPEYHEGYYGAYVFDPDGNNVEAVHHTVPSG